jgi:adenine phosphoribosyltransferase
MHDWKARVASYQPGRIEVGAIWTVPSFLKDVSADLRSLVSPLEFDGIATVETKGIIFAAPLAAALGLPLFLFRKRGRIIHTDNVFQAAFQNWRGEPDGIEIERELVADPGRVVIIDDVLQTSATFKAVHEIIGAAGGTTAAFVCFANVLGLDELAGRPVLSLVE